MSKSLRSLRAAASRRELVVALGGLCFVCGVSEGLEMDCIVPRGSQHHYMPFHTKIRFYWQEHLRANLQLLCRPCHRAKTRYDHSKGAPSNSTPFFNRRVLLLRAVNNVNNLPLQVE